MAKIVLEQSYQISDIQIAPSGNEKSVETHIAFISLLIGLLFCLYYIHETGFSALRLGNFEQERAQAIHGMSSIQQLSINFLTFGVAFIISSKRVLLSVKFIMFFVGIIAIFNFGNRAPILKLIVISGLVKMTIDKSINRKKILLISIIFAFLFVFLGILRKGMNQHYLENLFLTIGWRPVVTLLNLDIIYNAFESRPLMGYTYIMDLSTLLPGFQMNFGLYLKKYLGFMFPGGGITPSYIGIGYCNFETAGVLLYPILFGFLLHFIYNRIFANKPIALWNLVFIYMFSFSLCEISVVGIMGPLLTKVIPLTIVLFSVTGIKKILQNI